MRERLSAVADDWCISVERTQETASSVLGFGTREGRRVVLKIVRPGCDEWHAGSVAAAFGGRGVVRVLAHRPGAVLLEELRPGTTLVSLVVFGSDDEATRAIAGVVRAMQANAPGSCEVPSAIDWGSAFDWYVRGGRARIPSELVLDAEARYRELCRGQREARLLHGDLQHSNVLLDGERGWLAVDPKGVRAELEFELGAAFRNPREAADYTCSPAAIGRRLRVFAAELPVDPARVLGWAYSQAVLSAIWMVQDGFEVDESTLRLAYGVRSYLDHI